MSKSIKSPKIRYQYNNWVDILCHPPIYWNAYTSIFTPISLITILSFHFSHVEILNKTLPNVGRLSCFAFNDSCQASRHRTTSQPVSYWVEEAGPFITRCCGSLNKSHTGCWQMWVSFIGRNDNRHLCLHKSGGGLKPRNHESRGSPPKNTHWQRSHSPARVSEDYGGSPGRRWSLIFIVMFSWELEINNRCVLEWAPSTHEWLHSVENALQYVYHTDVFKCILYYIIELRFKVRAFHPLCLKSVWFIELHHSVPFKCITHYIIPSEFYIN